jgi:hypothetical protein
LSRLAERCHADLRDQGRTTVRESSRAQGAEAIARGLGLPAVSLTPDEAAAHFPSPFMATVYGFDAPVSSSRTQELLGWSPTHPALLDDLEYGDYPAAPAS